MKNAEQTKNSLAAFLVSRIAALRVRNNLSQRELSLRIGKESSYINRLEQSKFLPSVDTLYDIAEVCNSSLEEIIYRSLCMKRDIVQQDEKESGLRKLLNFGHTIGHGIESYYNLDTYLHGEAVTMGMFYFITSDEVKERLKNICIRMGLPISAHFDIQKVYQLTTMDKKASGGTISTVWVDEPGKSYMKELQQEEILTILQNKPI